MKYYAVGELDFIDQSCAAQVRRSRIWEISPASRSLHIPD